MRVRVGPAGWSYPDWEGRVYPRSKPRGFHPLRFLLPYVDCVEINSTFYAVPRAEAAARWVECVEPRPDLRFAAKLYQGFTHAPVDSGRWRQEAQQYRAGIAPLVQAERLGALLVQFPVSFLHGPDELARLADLRLLFEDLPLVLEVRHRSWFEPPALDALRGLGYSLAHIDLPDAWNHPPQRHAPTGALGYLRLHGRNSQQWFRSGAGRDDRYDYLYAPSEIAELANRAASIASEHDETYVVTNNHFEGKAVANALELRYLLSGQKPVPAPAELVASFPHLEAVCDVRGQGGLFA